MHEIIIFSCETQIYWLCLKGANTMTKIFVLRINSLVSSADSIMRFGSDNIVVIPLAVLDELQVYRGKPEKKRVAEMILSYLETFDVRKLMNEGVKQANGSILKIAENYHEISIDMDGLSETDKRIFQVCLGIQCENKDKKVVLVSKNNAIRIKARALGINAEDFRDDLFPAPSEQYSGRTVLSTTSSHIDSFFEKKYLDISNIIGNIDVDWVTNMFVEVKSIDSQQSFLGRYDGEKIVPLLFIGQRPYEASPKNVGQKFLLECLLTNWEKAPLVIAKGGAGTGKTYLSLASALQGIEVKEYSRLLVATPSETVGNEKLGFLPGDMKDKVSPYLGGIRDNLSILINGKGGNINKSSRHIENGEYYFETGIIQVQPIGFLRGRTIVNSIFIVDETQNIDPGDIKSIVTRAATGSKFIFLGDPTQVDNPKLNERYNGLVYLSEKFKGIPDCWQVTLGNSESVRSRLSTIASQIL